MPKGICQKCNKIWFGWALDINKVCSDCGNIIVVEENK